MLKRNVVLATFYTIQRKILNFIVTKFRRWEQRKKKKKKTRVRPSVHVYVTDVPRAVLDARAMSGAHTEFADVFAHEIYTFVNNDKQEKMRGYSVFYSLKRLFT